MFAIFFALYCTFRIFHNEALTEDVELLGDGDHPPAVLRQFIVRATLHSRIDDNKSLSDFISLDDFNKAASDGMEMGEKAFALLGAGPAFDDARFPEGIIEKCHAAAGDLMANWGNIREGLLEFKRGEKLAE
jgi:hypothetical protein